MRVLTVGNLPPHERAGGYEIVWHSANEHLRAQGHEVRVLTTPELRWYHRDGGFPKLSAREVVLLERHNHATLLRHLDEFRPDVLGWWSMGGMSLTLMETARRAGVPAVAFVHDDWLDYGRRADRYLNSRLERLVRHPATVNWAEAAHYAFVSKATATHAHRLGLPTPDQSILHSGIDPALIDPAPHKDWEWKLLFVGRLDPRKGLRTAIAALERLPLATLTVAGVGPDVIQAPRVSYLGNVPREQLKQLYADHDAVLFPVEWEEPWGLVALEAMARGRPVIATGRGGSAEYLRDGENALLFPAGDTKALTVCVQQLTDPALRRHLATAGVETARQHTELHFNQGVEQAYAARLRPRPAVATSTDIVMLGDQSTRVEHEAAHGAHPEVTFGVQGAIKTRTPFATWWARKGDPPLPEPRPGEVGMAYLDERNASTKRGVTPTRLVYAPRSRIRADTRIEDVLITSTLRDRIQHAQPARGRLRWLVPFVPESVPWLGPKVWASATRHYEGRLAFRVRRDGR